MNTQRPDQEKLDKFTAIFVKIDRDLESFCAQNGYQLDKNLNRQPCRVLRKGSNPEYIVEIFLTENWFTADFSQNLVYSMVCCAYYTPPEQKQCRWKLDKVLLENVPFLVVEEKLRQELSAALKFISSWTADIIIQKGKRMDNLKHLYSTEKS
jgi:hypothetical protein